MIPAVSSLDLVYTWVDLGWPGYAAESARYASQPVDLNPERTRDHYTLLRYSLRSVERYFSHFRNVILLTARPQAPAWINRAHPRLRLVHHDEVAAPADRPTFNSNAIESHLHLIPGLSEHFLYLNDDFLFGRATTPEDFYARDGRIKVFGTWAGERLPFRVHEDGHWSNLFSWGPIEHTPLLIDRALWADMLASRPAEVRATRAQKFRAPADLRMDKLYRQHLLARHRDRAVAEPAWRLLRYHRFHKIRNNFAAQKSAFAKLRALRPKFYCLNDDQGDRPDERVSALVRAFLDEHYPQPSSFERDS